MKSFYLTEASIYLWQTSGGVWGPTSARSLYDSVTLSGRYYCAAQSVSEKADTAVRWGEAVSPQQPYLQFIFSRYLHSTIYHILS